MNGTLAICRLEDKEKIGGKSRRDTEKGLIVVISLPAGESELYWSPGLL
jgi:hypothetical protein